MQIPTALSGEVAESRKHRAILGCLLGTAVGDALGLPCEALSRRRQQKLFPQIDGHHFFFGRGMISDDTEHSCMTAQALIVSAGEPGRFSQNLAWRLRWWLMSFPSAIGMATLRALLKLWIGFPPDQSGVFSAGNGPAMRSAILGVCYGDDLPRLRKLVKTSTRITHTDPKAEWAALAVAVAAHRSFCGEATAKEFFAAFRNTLGDDAKQAEEFLDLLNRAARSAASSESTESFADSLGLKAGVSGYSYHTVPVAVHTWLRQPDDFSAVLHAIRCGGYRHGRSDRRWNHRGASRKGRHPAAVVGANLGVAAKHGMDRAGGGTSGAGLRDRHPAAGSPCACLGTRSPKRRIYGDCAGPRSASPSPALLNCGARHEPNCFQTVVGDQS